MRTSFGGDWGTGTGLGKIAEEHGTLCSPSRFDAGSPAKAPVVISRTAGYAPEGLYDMAAGTRPAVELSPAATERMTRTVPGGPTCRFTCCSTACRPAASWPKWTGLAGQASPAGRCLYALCIVPRYGCSHILFLSLSLCPSLSHSLALALSLIALSLPPPLPPSLFLALIIPMKSGTKSASMWSCRR